MTKPPTQTQLEKYSNIAVTIREGMAKRGWDKNQLAEAIGKPRGYPSVYGWYNGTGAPGKNIIPVLARVLNVPKESLQWRNKEPEATSGLDKQLVVAPAVKAVAAGPTDIVTFNITPDGKAHLRLDLVLPLDQGNLLFQTIMLHQERRRK